MTCWNRDKNNEHLLWAVGECNEKCGTTDYRTCIYRQRCENDKSSVSWYLWLCFLKIKRQKTNVSNYMSSLRIMGFCKKSMIKDSDKVIVWWYLWLIFLKMKRQKINLYNKIFSLRIWFFLKNQWSKPWYFYQLTIGAIRNGQYITNSIWWWQR